ncbi:MAG: DUF1801 domain-containing protein [Acidaminobacteraceae bacterium]
MNIEVEYKISNYTDQISELLFKLRDIILSIANEENLGDVEETLKWGEASYKVKGGSPIRIDWKSKTPENYYIFFNCKTKLVETFREIYSDDLCFQGNRAIVLKVDENLPEKSIRHCLSLAMKYKLLKDLPLLGE